MTNKIIQEKINAIDKNLEYLQEQAKEQKGQQDLDKNVKDFYDNNTAVLGELGIKTNDPKHLTNKIIQEKINAIDKNLEYLQEQAKEQKGQQDLDKNVKDFYDNNTAVLGELGIKTNDQKQLTLNDIEGKRNDINKNLEVLQKQANEKQGQQDLDKDVKDFYKKNATVLEKLGIGQDNIANLNATEIERKIKSAAEYLEAAKQNPDKCELKRQTTNSFINEHENDINEFKKSDEDFASYVTNISKQLTDKNLDFKAFKQYHAGLVAKMNARYKKIFNEQKKKMPTNLNNLDATMPQFKETIKKQMTENKSKLENDNNQLQELKQKYEQLRTETEQLEKSYNETKQILEDQKHDIEEKTGIEYKSFYEVANANDIKKLNDKIKKLNAFYTVRRTLEQQAGLLNANKYVFGTLNYKLLEAAKKEEEGKNIVGKSVNELLIGENAIIKTNYFAKDDLQKIKEQQTDEDKKNKGCFNTVLKYNDEFLKEGLIFKSFDSKGDAAQLLAMGYSKKNSDVLIDEAYKNNITNEIAQFFGFDVIIGSDVVVSDGNNNILMMDDASKDTRKTGNSPLNAKDATDLKNNKDKLQKLWDSTSALAFIDIVLMHTDRNPGNYFYNEESVRGIDNDCFAIPTNNFKKHYQIDFKKINQIRNKTDNNREYDESNIKAMALAKMPVISTDLKHKIINIDKKQFEIQLNLSFRDDINCKDKVNSILSRFDTLISLIKDGTIEVCEKIDDDVISKIEAYNEIVYAELFLATSETYASGDRGNDRFLYNNQFLSILSEIVDYAPERAAGVNIYLAGMSQNFKQNDKEAAYHTKILQKILDKNQPTDKDKPLLAKNELGYISKLKKGIENMK